MCLSISYAACSLQPAPLQVTKFSIYLHTRTKVRKRAENEEEKGSIGISFIREF
jgi:hypothetical protein